jgi:hypothetical protein
MFEVAGGRTYFRIGRFVASLWILAGATGKIDSDVDFGRVPGVPLQIPDKPLALHHILRDCPPWRDPATRRTECGRQGPDMATVELTEAARLVQAVGKTRAKEQLCITCFETAGNWPRWQEDPAAVVARECGAHGGRFGFSGKAEDFSHELRAIAALIQAHREEFDELVTGHQATVSLHEARAAKRRTRR